MKILFVSNAKGRGGGEEFLRDLLPGLAGKGITVGLICRPGTPLEEMFRNTAVRLHPLDRSGLKGLSAVFKTTEVIRKGGYHIVNVQRSHDIIQSWLARLLSCSQSRMVYTVQVAEFMKSRFLLSRMHRIVTISRHIRDKMLSYAPEIGPRLGIIYYGINLEQFRPAADHTNSIKQRFGLPENTKIIGTVGDLWKNQVEFLDAFEIIAKEIRDVRFALVASAAETPEAVAFIKRSSELGLEDRLLWPGRLSKEEMLSFYRGIDLAVSTHRNEGFGIWVLEALAAGTPVVSVNEGGIRDSLEGCPAGVLVDGGPADMATAVVRILKDASFRRRMAAAGPQWVARQFSKERMVDDYYRFFEGICKDHQGRCTGPDTV